MGERDNPARVVLFYRDFQRFTGGHLKVWHYYQHLAESRRFRPRVFFSERSVWGPENPWFSKREECARTRDPLSADILFLAGVDWLMLEDHRPLPDELPIINLIQGARHAEPDDFRYRFLSRRAVRICVSEQVAQRLHASRQVNGPVFTIVNGLDLDRMPWPKSDALRDIPVLIVGLKNPNLAKALARRLRKRNVPAEPQLTHLPRENFLEQLNRSKVTVLLPLETEGFYLPALEAMALCTVVVCPDCVGNRSFCRHNVNSLVPSYDLDELFQITLWAHNLTFSDRKRLVTAAYQTVPEYSLVQERKRFLEVMDNLNQIW